MQSFQFLRSARSRQGGGFFSRLGALSRPWLRSMARSGGPLVKQQMKKMGSDALTTGAKMLTEETVATLDEEQKKRGGMRGYIKRHGKRAKTSSGGKAKRRRKNKKKGRPRKIKSTAFGGNKRSKKKRVAQLGGERKRVRNAEQRKSHFLYFHKKWLLISVTVHLWLIFVIYHHHLLSFPSLKWMIRFKRCAS